jgi:hypothetical protein
MSAGTALCAADVISSAVRRAVIREQIDALARAQLCAIMA